MHSGLVQLFNSEPDFCMKGKAGYQESGWIQICHCCKSNRYVIGLGVVFFWEGEGDLDSNDCIAVKSCGLCPKQDQYDFFLGSNECVSLLALFSSCFPICPS